MCCKKRCLPKGGPHAGMDLLINMNCDAETAIISGNGSESMIDVLKEHVTPIWTFSDFQSFAKITLLLILDNGVYIYIIGMLVGNLCYDGGRLTENRIPETPETRNINTIGQGVLLARSRYRPILIRP